MHIVYILWQYYTENFNINRLALLTSIVPQTYIHIYVRLFVRLFIFKKIMFNSVKSSLFFSFSFLIINIVAQILSIELDSIFSIKHVIKMQSCKIERSLYLIVCSALIGTQWAGGRHKCQAAHHMVQAAARQRWPFHPIPVMLHHVMLLTQGNATRTALLHCF